MTWTTPVPHTFPQHARTKLPDWLVAARPFCGRREQRFDQYFVTPDELTDADKSCACSNGLPWPWDEVTVTLTALDGKVSKPIFEMSGGSAYLASRCRCAPVPL